MSGRRADLLHPGRCVVMGVLNVTPDSFSDGGCFADPEVAVAHGLAMAAAGADYVDVGGESTRPGADRVDAAEERRRVVPVVRELASAGVRVSVDTTRTEVAAAALDEHLEPRGVIVVIEAEHLCMGMRGIRKPGSTTVTSAVRGMFRDNPATRAEAMSLVLGR